MKKNKKFHTWAEIDLNAVAYNLKQINHLAAQNYFYIATHKKAKKIQRAGVLTVIKADAYGHGMDKVALCLKKNGVEYFAVSDIREGIRLRKLGVKNPILLFESTLPEMADDIIDYDLTPTICTLELAEAINKRAKRKKKRVSIHVKVDTGMGRLGIWCEDVLPFIAKLQKMTYLIIEGIYTHFSSADSDRSFTEVQIGRLYDLIISLDKKGLVVPLIHASNSMGLAGYKTNILNLVRPGILLYGLYPDPQAKKALSLKPAMSVKSRVIFIKKVEKGRTISYGHTFTAKKSMTVATVPIGYNDGYFRAFSNKAHVLINGQCCKVLGRVTMDQIIVDVSKVKAPKLGMGVVILGQSKNKSVTAEDLAEWAGTINYEIVCSLGNRLPRVYKTT